MDKLADYLIEKETITGKEFMKIYRKEKGIPEPKEDEKEKKSKKEEAFSDKKENTETKISSENAQSNPAEQQFFNNGEFVSREPVTQQNTPPVPPVSTENPNVGLFSHSSLTPDFSQTLAQEKTALTEPTQQSEQAEQDFTQTAETDEKSQE